MSELDETKTTTRRSRKSAVKPINSDDAHVEAIRNGGWKQVFESVGSTEYNRLRRVALQK